MSEEMNGKTSLAELSCADYLALLGSNAPAPGGGAASAFTAAQGCLALMDEDAQAYQGVMDVFALPKETEEDKIFRSAAMEMALRECTKTPFRIMLLSEEALQLTAALVGRTNANAASDLACAALDLKAAVQGAWLNVKVNTVSLKDRTFAAQYEKDAEAILSRALPLADRITQTAVPYGT